MSTTTTTTHGWLLYVLKFEQYPDKPCQCHLSHYCWTGLPTNYRRQQQKGEHISVLFAICHHMTRYWLGELVWSNYFVDRFISSCEYASNWHLASTISHPSSPLLLLLSPKAVHFTPSLAIFKLAFLYKVFIDIFTFFVTTTQFLEIRFLQHLGRTFSKWPILCQVGCKTSM